MKTSPACYIYSNTEITEIFTDESVPLMTNGFIRGGVEHDEGSKKITVKSRGLYRVSFIIGTLEPAVFGLTVNGRLVTNSLTRSEVGQKVIGQTILQLERGDCIEIRNCTGNRVAVRAFAGGIERAVFASLLMHVIQA
jgi:hypothetical protein